MAVILRSYSGFLYLYCLYSLRIIDELNQRLADLSGIPIYCPAECEATARGTAYLLAEQPSNWPEENIELTKRYNEWMALMLKTMRSI